MITLNPLFSDGTVFQQQKPIPVWGWAVAGNRLQAEFADQKAITKAASNGKFIFRLPPVNAGGPFVLTITDLDSGEKIVVNDILVGEVWLASGQSNMEYTLSTDWVKSTDEEYHSPLCVNRMQEKEYCDTIEDPSIIRFITVEKRASGLEEDSFCGNWKYMSKENAPQASAVAAWFARFLQEKINVPVGLVISSWGGTIVEAWTSRSGLCSNPETAPLVYDVDKTLNDENSWNRPETIAFQLPLPLEKCLDPGNEGFKKGWANLEFDDSAWSEMDIPGSWISQKVSGNGALWVRKEVELPMEWAGKNLVLNMGGIDKHDVTYFNGVKIGGTGEGIDVSCWDKLRQYKIPGELVKSGKNIIAVRAYSFMYDGAFHGMKRDYHLDLEDSDDKISICGNWKAKAELDLGSLRPTAILSGPGNPKTPGILFDSMIRPLIPFAIRGVIWYQGETNANFMYDALTYEDKISTMIKDWRYQWGQGDFPFIQTQLANYSPNFDPEFVAASCWAVLRDAQRTVCEKQPEVYMCSAVDVGELSDIHPQNKKSVGVRMAAYVLHNVYGYENIVPSGPLFRSYSVEGNSIRIYFRYSDGLRIREDLCQSFYIAGSDHVFHPATTAKVEGNSIIVSCSEVTRPFAIRYGWSDAAVSTVYNAAGLPASPFRTDDWYINA